MNSSCLLPFFVGVNASNYTFQDETSSDQPLTQKFINNLLQCFKPKDPDHDLANLASDSSIVFIVFGLVKRLETRMLLIVAGFILCCASGAPMKAFGAFVKGMTNITLVPAICSAMGFAFAVQALNVTSTSLLQ